MPESQANRSPVPSESGTGASVLGIDYGERRIGVAIGNTLTGTGTPLQTLAARNGIPEWHRLDTLIERWRPGMLVVGLPHTDDGSEHPLAVRIRAFSDHLRMRYGLPVQHVDEQFSSATAQSHLTSERRAGRRGRISKGDIDALAAAVLLEHWLSQRSCP